MIKMMKVALIKPPATYADWYKRPLLSITYICSCLEADGYQCKIFDAYFHSWSTDEIISLVRDYGPDAVGITAMTHEIVQASQIAAGLKEYLDVPVIVGGCHLTALPGRTLEEFPAFDYGVYGEGEKTILELLEFIRCGRHAELNTVKGLVFRTGGGSVCVNEPRQFLQSQELDLLPYPAFHQYYEQNPHVLSGKDSYYVMASGRGCPYSCIFCMQVLGHKIRRRSTENICQEIKHAVSAFGAHTIDFVDEIFLFDTKDTRNLLQRMIEEGLPQRVKWRGLVHASFVNTELIALAKKAGCFRLEMGVESGDDEILQAIGKGVTVEKVRKACRIIKDAGITLGAYFILGHPHETKETLRKTINVAVELNPEHVAFGLMVPYPGTKVFTMALRGEGGYRLLTQDWSKFDKYFTQSLEIKDLPYDALVKWQVRALLTVYLKNFRVLEILQFLWLRRRGVWVFIRQGSTRLIGRILKRQELL